jgi:hypothetical protein
VCLESRDNLVALAERLLLLLFIVELIVLQEVENASRGRSRLGRFGGFLLAVFALRSGSDDRLPLDHLRRCDWGGLGWLICLGGSCLSWRRFTLNLLVLGLGQQLEQVMNMFI